MVRWIFRLFILVILLAGGAWATRGKWWGKSISPAASFRTAAVTKGDLVVTISSTGTIQPEKVVDIGAQVAGLITGFGSDADGKPVDYGSRVEEGAVLARLDDAVYAADLAQAEAQVQSAAAGIRKAEADLVQATARHEQAARDWKRAQDVGPSEALSQAAFDGYQSSFETTRAAVAVAEAGIAQAKAQLEVTDAQRRKAKRNLDFCTIRTPVTGVIIDRRVNIGQTVVASLNAPSLFLLAKDLTRLQVWAQVNEADIGRIRTGQKVRLSVDAFPGETFEGAVEKVRLNASMSQNVVTYTVEVSLDNRDGKLLPYLTASVQFEITRRPDVLLVPASALRWTPSAEQIAPAHRTPPSPSTPPSGSSGRPGGGKPGAGPKVWVKEGAFVKPLPVRPIESDGVNIEVEGEGLSDGLEIVTGFIAPVSAGSPSSNPLAPKIMGPGGSGGGGRPSGGRPSGAH